MEELITSVSEYLELYKTLKTTYKDNQKNNWAQDNISNKLQCQASLHFHQKAIWRFTEARDGYSSVES